MSIAIPCNPPLFPFVEHVLLLWLLGNSGFPWFWFLKWTLTHSVQWRYKATLQLATRVPLHMGPHMSTCPFWCLQPHHVTWDLYPSSVDALLDVHGRSCNFPLIHPREVCLAGCWVTALPLLSCGIIICSLPLEVGLHGVGMIHLSHAWWMSIHKGMPTSNVMRSQFWWRMSDLLHWSITS